MESCINFKNPSLWWLAYSRFEALQTHCQGLLYFIFFLHWTERIAGKIKLPFKSFKKKRKDTDKARIQECHIPVASRNNQWKYTIQHIENVRYCAEKAMLWCDIQTIATLLNNKFKLSANSDKLSVQVLGRCRYMAAQHARGVNPIFEFNHSPWAKGKYVSSAWKFYYSFQRFD